MAKEYEVLTSYRGLQVFTGTQLRDAEIVTAATIPSGMRFATAIDLGIWELDGGVNLLNGISGILEELVAGSHAVGSSESQDFDNNGLLAFFCDVVVELDRSAQGLPNLTAEAHIPMRNIEYQANAPGGTSGAPQTAASMCDEVYARLEQMNAG